MQVHKAYFWGVKESPYLQVSVGGHFKTWKLWMSGHPWRNVVDQQLPTLLDVTCYVCLHTLLLCCCVLLGVIETGQTFSYVHANGRNNSQHCWANNVGNYLKEASHRSYRRNFCSCEMKAWKKFRFFYHNGIRTLDLCDTGEALYQLCSCEMKAWKKFRFVS